LLNQTFFIYLFFGITALLNTTKNGHILTNMMIIVLSRGWTVNCPALCEIVKLGTP